MPFLLYHSSFIKEEIWVEVYFEATCETVEKTFQKLTSKCWILQGKVNILLILDTYLWLQLDIWKKLLSEICFLLTSFLSLHFFPQLQKAYFQKPFA